MTEMEKFSLLINDAMQDIMEDIDMEKLENLRLLANEAVQNIKDNAESTDIEISWQDEIMEYITRNLELSSRYGQRDILEIKIVCRLYETMHISVRTDKGTWKGAMAKDISYEKIMEKDRDLYKDCCCREVLWVEFCDACSEVEVNSIMNAVCDLLGRKYNVKVNLIFQ